MNNYNNHLTYTQVGDYFIPNLALSVAATDNIGKYGRLRKQYLQEHRPGLYNRLVLTEKLQTHLLEVEQTAQRRLEAMIPQLAATAGATEELKASNLLRWVGLMNTCKAQAEEIIFTELIYN